MNYLVLATSLLAFTVCGFSQNKKEKIDELNIRVDSCKNVLNAQNNQINQLKLELDKLKNSEIKLTETIKQKDNQISALEVQKNQLLTENKIHKEKIQLLENPPIELAGKYSISDAVGFYFMIEVFEEHDSGFSFRYESSCRLGGQEFGSSGEGQAIREISSKNEFRCLGGSLQDDASGEAIQIEFVFASNGLSLNISNSEDGAFCWESDQSFILVKTE